MAFCAFIGCWPGGIIMAVPRCARARSPTFDGLWVTSELGGRSEFEARRGHIASDVRRLGIQSMIAPEPDGASLASKSVRTLVPPLFLGEQRHLGTAGTLCLEPIACWPPAGRFAGDAGPRIVKPVLVRLFVRRAENRILDGLDRDGFVSICCHVLGVPRATRRPRVPAPTERGRAALPR